MNDTAVSKDGFAPEAKTFSESHEALVERWWADHFPGSPVARDTQAWNVAYTAKKTLKRLLKRSI